MIFADWQSLPPDGAVRTLRDRLAVLSSAQHRAAVAWLRPAADLREAFHAANRATPLGGVPWFAKDLFDVAGQPTLAGSTFLNELRPMPARDSAMVRKLHAAGAVLAGKAHLHEFAYGLTGENPHYGDCEHPRFPGRTTGGSSSGSAALVSAGVVPFAAGTDTGCSLRLPAAFCGLFSYRLTPHDNWIRDAVPLAPSFDTAGWFTQNAGDLRTLLTALMGINPASCEPRGVFLDWPDLDADCVEPYRHAADLHASRADPALQHGLLAAFAPSAGAYSVIVGQEALAWHRPWLEKYAGHYDPAVLSRLRAAAKLTPQQIDIARQTMAAVRSCWHQFFQQHDFLILPAAPMPALTKAACTPANRQRILACNAPASIGGLPVLTVPVSLPSGLSLGLQIILPDPQSPVVSSLLRQLAV